MSKSKSPTARPAARNQSIRRRSRDALKGGPKSVKKDQRAGNRQSAKG